MRTADGSTGWRGDSLRAGGGILLNGAYQQVDMLVHLMGMPIFVDAQCCTAVAPGKACNYDTEDAAQLAMRFTGERIASLTASLTASEPFWKVTLIGAPRESTLFARVGRPGCAYTSQRRIARQTLCPPKPKELLNARRTGRSARRLWA